MGWRYVFAASREWRIKTVEQLNAALVVEEEHFSKSLDEFMAWLRSNGLRLGNRGEGYLRHRLAELYVHYPCNVARKNCELLAQEDEDNPSNVYS